MIIRPAIKKKNHLVAIGRKEVKNPMEDYEIQHECWKWDLKGVCVECHQKTLEWADVNASIAEAHNPYGDE